MLAPSGGRTAIERGEKTARLALALTEGIGPQRGRLLLQSFGSAEAVLAAPPRTLEERGRLPLGIAVKLGQALAWAEEETARLEELGGFALVWGEEDYPELLAQIPAPPLALFGQGALRPEDGQAVAVVGSRMATDYGRRTTLRLAAELAQAGMTVVSGLAVGIDAAAHEGALEGGGRTIGVLGCGLNIDYPRENAGLKKRIRAQGAILTEYPLDTQPRPGLFPVRNRIIAGLAKGVVVAEASPRSGSLITANLANDFGRAVMAVPGPLTDRRREGTHRLIREGARLVTSAQEVLEELWPEAPQVQAGQPALFGLPPARPPAKPVALEPGAAKLYSLLEAEPRHVDDLIRSAGLSPEEVQAGLMDLELEGLARRLPGQNFVKV